MLDSQRPRVAKTFRLQWEQAQDAHVLLYPEGMVKLNKSAGEILSRCNGVASVSDIVADLERTFGRSGLYSDVVAFVNLAHEHGWIELDARDEPDGRV
jgi:pyrroloquinoline quinone biosynthesis protein D